MDIGAVDKLTDDMAELQDEHSPQNRKLFSHWVPFAMNQDEGHQRSAGAGVHGA